MPIYLHAYSEPQSGADSLKNIVSHALCSSLSTYNLSCTSRTSCTPSQCVIYISRISPIRVMYCFIKGYVIIRTVSQSTASPCLDWHAATFDAGQEKHLQQVPSTKAFAASTLNSLCCGPSSSSILLRQGS